MNKQKSWNNLIALLVCLALAFTDMPVAVFAEEERAIHNAQCTMHNEGDEGTEATGEAEPPEETSSADGETGDATGGDAENPGEPGAPPAAPGVTANRITAFAPLPEGVRFQRGQASELVLPETVEATVDGESVTIPVTWPNPDGHTPRTPGLHVFTAAIPEPYTLAEDIEAPSLSFMQAGLARIAGYGTELNPLEIRNAEQLEEVAALVNAGTLETTVFGVSDQTVYLKLMNDIALSGEWTPIGTSINPFKGVFDGNGNAITGLTITVSGFYQGLFGYIDGGSIKDLMLKDVNVRGSRYVGGVAGRVDGGGRVENCTVAVRLLQGADPHRRPDSERSGRQPRP